MTLFDYPRPEDLLKPKVLVRLPEDPLFGPTRHGEDFSARYQDDGEIRLRGFERGLPQLDLDQQSAPKSPFSRGMATEDDSGGDEAAAKKFESTDFVGANATGADVASADAMVADVSSAEEVDSDSNRTVREADAALTDKTQLPSELAADTDSITTEGDPSLSADGDSQAMDSAADNLSLDPDADASMGSAQDAAALQNVSEDEGFVSGDPQEEGVEDLDASVDASADASASGGAEEFSAEAAEAEKHLIGLDELEAIRREAYEMGFQEGQAALAEGGADAGSAIDADATQAIESVESADEAYLRGIEEGQQQARSELEAEVMLAADDWRELTKSLAVAARDAEAFHQPLLKLSMHLAEQMVRGELTLSGHAITRLVDRALSELQHESAVPIVVRMNPDDLQRFKAYSTSIDEQVDVRADPKLMSGSIRVAMNGSMIDDLIEHRRDALWQSLMAAAEGIEDSPPDSFLKNVAMVKEAMEAVDFGAELSPEVQGVVDAAPADPTAPDSVLPPDAEPN